MASTELTEQKFHYVIKGVGVSPILCGCNIWGIKMPPHIQDKCDSTLISLGVSHFTTYL